MNIKQLKELIKIFEESSLFSLEIQDGAERVSLKRKPAAPSVPLSIEKTKVIEPLPPPVQESGNSVDFNRIIEVTSPVVGVYYEAPEPGGKPFIKVGDLVQRGDVLCLIEVMKQVTEVTAPQNGQVVDICVQNGNVVEYGQTLVKLC